jgi:hypothetical protein
MQGGVTPLSGACAEGAERHWAGATCCQRSGLGGKSTGGSAHCPLAQFARLDEHAGLPIAAVLSIMPLRHGFRRLPDPSQEATASPLATEGKGSTRCESHILLARSWHHVRDARCQ